jgi:hypothetical protein
MGWCVSGIQSTRIPRRALVPIKFDASPRLAQFSPSGKQLLVALEVGSENSLLQIYNADTHPAMAESSLRRTAQPSPPNTQSDDTLAVSPDHTRLVKKTGTSAVLCEARNSQPLAPPLPIDVDLGDQGDFLQMFAKFSRDGHCFVTGVGAHPELQKGSARLWDGFNSRPLTEPLRHDRMVIGAAFSRDSRRLFTVAAEHWDGAGCEPRLWDVQTGRPLSDAFLTGEGVHANTAEFIQDGRRVRVSWSESEEEHVEHVLDVGFSPEDRAPKWLAQLAKLATGYQLNEKSGTIEPVSGRVESLRQLRAQLAAMSADDSYVAFGRWVLNDVGKRTISPYSSKPKSATK